MLALVAAFVSVIADLIAAGGDAAKEEEALMRAGEITKEELDRRKFGKG